MALILFTLQAAVLVMLALLWRRRHVSRVLLLLLFFTFAMWNLTATATNTLFWEQRSWRPLARYGDFVHMALLETAVFLATLCVFLLRRPYWEAVRRLGPALATGWREAALVAAVAAADVVALIVSTRQQGASYWERNAYVVVKLQTQGFGIVGILFVIETALSALVIAMLLMRRPSTPAGRTAMWIGVVWVGWKVVYDLLLGSRLSLVTPVIVIVLLGEVRRWPSWQRIWTTATVACLSVVVGGVISVAVSRERGSQELTVSRIVSASVDLVEPRGERPAPAPVERRPGPAASAPPAKRGVALSVVQEIGTKFDNISLGRVLLDYYGVEQAGWRPYWGAALSLVPRAVLSSKPVPGSRDGTFLGHPARLVPVALGQDPTYANMGISPAAVALWQLGLLGLPLLVLSNAVQLVLLNSLLLGESVLGRGVALLVICIPSFGTFFASPDVVLMNFQRAAAACLVIAALGWMWPAPASPGEATHGDGGGRVRS